MGLAASQARLLSITARKADCEFQSMTLSHEKIALARNMERLSDEYQDALKQTKLVYDYYGSGTSQMDLTYGLLMSPSSYNDYSPKLITNAQNKVVLDSKFAAAAAVAGIPVEGYMGTPSSDVRNRFVEALVDSNIISASTGMAIQNVTYNNQVGLGNNMIASQSTMVITYEDLLNELNANCISTSEYGLTLGGFYALQDNNDFADWYYLTARDRTVNGEIEENGNKITLDFSEESGWELINETRAYTGGYINSQLGESGVGLYVNDKENNRVEQYIDPDHDDGTRIPTSGEKNSRSITLKELLDDEYQFNFVLGVPDTTANYPCHIDFYAKNRCANGWHNEHDFTASVNFEDPESVAAERERLWNEYVNANWKADDGTWWNRTKQYQREYGWFIWGDESSYNGQEMPYWQATMYKHADNYADEFLEAMRKGYEAALESGTSRLTESHAKDIAYLQQLIIGDESEGNFSFLNWMVDQFQMVLGGRDENNMALQYAYNAVYDLLYPNEDVQAAAASCALDTNPSNDTIETYQSIVTDLGNKVGLDTLKEKSQNYLGIVNVTQKGHQGVSVNLNNLAKVFLTAYVEYMGGVENSDYQYNVGAVSGNNLYEPKNGDKFTILGSTEVDDSTDNLTATYYDMLFNQICVNGWTQNNKVSDSEYMQEMLKSGTFFISSINNDNNYYQNAYSSDVYVSEITDADAVAQAEAKYNAEKAKIESKENIIDMKMKNLDTEVSALTTEYDTTKNLINKTIEKTLKRYEA